MLHSIKFYLQQQTTGQFANPWARLNAEPRHSEIPYLCLESAYQVQGPTDRGTGKYST